ncbi:MAG: hypothetical protein SGARI_007859, partial [Bacillariaceae sp.]
MQDVTLPGSYQAKASDSGVEHSRTKLVAASERLSQRLKDIDPYSRVAIQTFPCLSEEETWSYRCRCSFQIVKDNGSGSYAYAMRQQGRPISIGSSTFPIANQRIQAAMKIFVEEILNGDAASFTHMRDGLSSCTFSSAWHDVPEADCILTLNYDGPLDQVPWREQAGKTCKMMQL